MAILLKRLPLDYSSKNTFMFHNVIFNKFNGLEIFESLKITNFNFLGTTSLFNINILMEFSKMIVYNIFLDHVPFVFIKQTLKKNFEKL